MGRNVATFITNRAKLIIKKPPCLMGSIVFRQEILSPRTIHQKHDQFNLFLDWKFIAESVFDSMDNELTEEGVKRIIRSVVYNYFDLFDETKKNIIVRFKLIYLRCLCYINDCCCAICINVILMLMLIK